MSFLWHGLTEQGAQVPVQVDAQGRVIAVDGTPGVSNWERTGTTLSPAVPGDYVVAGSPAGGVNNDYAAMYPSGQIYLVKKDDVTANPQSKDFLRCIQNGGSLMARINGDGSAEFKGDINIGKIAAPNITLNADGSSSFIKSDTVVFLNTSPHAFEVNTSNETKASINSDGSATFAGNITAPNVTFRSADPQFYVKKSKHKDALPEYVGPELDLLAEIARLEALVRHLYETLRLAPPAGWPVWDGNDDVLRQLRK